MPWGGSWGGQWGGAWNGATPPILPAPAGVYVSPTLDLIKLLTGVNRDIERITEEDLNGKLQALIPVAEARTALAVGIPLFDSTSLSPRQVTALQIAVAKRVGADYYRAVAGKKATGTEEPLMMEAVQSILALADALEAEAATYDTLAAGVPVVEGEPGGGELGTLSTGTILTNVPNEYLDSYHPSWVDPATLVYP